MSGTNLKCLVLYRVLFGACYAVIFYSGSFLPAPDPKDPISCVFHPAVFPDTLCVASLWSPVYPGFGIHEGLIYGGGPRFDISLKTQYHKLMSNHCLSVGFPLLSDANIKAGLQLHYTLSTVHGEESIHKGSCSGGFSLNLNPDWQVSLCSMHVLCYPADSTEHVLESLFRVGTDYRLLPSLGLRAEVKKTAALPWDACAGILWQPVPLLACSVNYEFYTEKISFELVVSPGKWTVRVAAGSHPYLGLTQQIMIAYVR